MDRKWCIVNVEAAIYKGDKWLVYKEVHRLYEIAPPPKNYILSEGGFHSAPLFPGKLRGRWISWLVSVLT